MCRFLGLFGGYPGLELGRGPLEVSRWGGTRYNYGSQYLGTLLQLFPASEVYTGQAKWSPFFFIFLGPFFPKWPKSMIWKSGKIFSTLAEYTQITFIWGHIRPLWGKLEQCTTIAPRGSGPPVDPLRTSRGSPTEFHLPKIPEISRKKMKKVAVLWAPGPVCVHFTNYVRGP